VPLAPQKPCRRPGCPGLTRAHFCDKHEGSEPRPDQRPSRMRSGDPVYSSTRWRNLRAVVLSEQPACATAGCGAASRVVDHIRPHRGDPFRMWERANLQGLCVKCHGVKTAAEDGGYGNARRGAR
jgi:5-methylcytosine-specific restriction enzyme A